jgi:hypothetical protein
VGGQCVNKIVSQYILESLYSNQFELSYMNKQCTIATTLGLGIVLLAIAICFIPLQHLLAISGNDKTENLGGTDLQTSKSAPTTNPSGLNATTGSNMTGAAGNTTEGTHGSSIPITNNYTCRGA